MLAPAMVVPQSRLHIKARYLVKLPTAEISSLMLLVFPDDKLGRTPVLTWGVGRVFVADPRLGIWSGHRGLGW
ncbi:hypothetical protein P5673_008413, partial [Acropora cervicornis]